MKTTIAVLVVIAAVIISIGVYLGPDDLAHCGARPSGVSSCRKADAIVAVSGGDTVARTGEAIALYKEGWAPKLIFSGAAEDKTGPSNAEVMRRQARSAGIPDDDILTDEAGATTKQNAENSESIFLRSDIKSVILVTSAYHQRRASLEFNKEASGTVNIRNHPVATDNQWHALWWLTPTGWYLAISELIKIAAFYAGDTR